MAQKYTDVANGTGGTRFLGVAKAFTTLSDGTPIWLEWDPLASQMSLCYSSDRATTHVITAVGGFHNSGNGQSIMLVRDASDNIYVVGTDATNHPAIAAWAKGSGYTWTAKATLSSTTAFGNAMDCVGSVWCNVGTTGAVLAIYASTASGATGYASLSCSIALAGTGDPMLAVSTAPTFLNNGAAILTNASALCDLAQDGFGAASGIAVVATSGSALALGTWAVNSSGLLSTNTFVGTQGGGSFVAGRKLRTLRLASNLYAVVYPSNSGTGHWVAIEATSTTWGGATDSGAPTNLPLNAYTTVWDAFVDPTNSSKVWVLAPDLSFTNVYRAGVLMSTTPTWDTAATLDDTLTIVSGTSSSCRAALDQTSGTTRDWQVYAETNSTPTYALLGDYSSFGGNPIFMIV